MEINSVNVVEKNPVPKSQTNPYYIGTKEAPSDLCVAKTKALISFAVFEYAKCLFSHDAVQMLNKRADNKQKLKLIPK